MVGKGKMLSKVDLSKGFHQVEVAVEDRDIDLFACYVLYFFFLRLVHAATPNV